MDWAFDALGWDEVVHTINPANAASIRVALRLGSQLRGPARLPPPFEDVTVDVYAQDRRAWRSRALS